jgi:hypothetical protein
MSLHEIYWRLQKIGLRTNSDRSFKASLQGLKLESNGPIREDEKNIDLSDDQKEAMKIALNKARERKRLEYGGQ